MDLKKPNLGESGEAEIIKKVFLILLLFSEKKSQSDRQIHNLNVSF